MSLKKNLAILLLGAIAAPAANAGVCYFDLLELTPSPKCQPGDIITLIKARSVSKVVPALARYCDHSKTIATYSGTGAGDEVLASATCVYTDNGPNR
ncbi:MAG: hypothetical protein QJR02_02015 [Sinobacteraceae bacterium]|nr:hypothetical protein [Nevskiaceae bacterium]